MSDFHLAVESFTPPNLPAYSDVPASAIRSSLISNPTNATSPLKITLSLGEKGLSPATHLQLCWLFAKTGAIFAPSQITAKDLVKQGELYEVVIPASEVVRAKVNEGETTTCELVLYAWKRAKLLGEYSVGFIEGLGLEGYKSFDLAKRRVEQQRQMAGRMAQQA